MLFISFISLLIADIVCWVIFAFTTSGTAGLLGMFFLVLLLSIISGLLGVNPLKRSTEMREEIDAARINEYRLKGLYDSITNNKNK